MAAIAQQARSLVYEHMLPYLTLYANVEMLQVLENFSKATQAAQAIQVMPKPTIVMNETECMDTADDMDFEYTKDSMDID